MMTMPTSNWGEGRRVGDRGEWVAGRIQGQVSPSSQHIVTEVEVTRPEPSPKTAIHPLSARAPVSTRHACEDKAESLS